MAEAREAVLLVGARPNFVKASALTHAAAGRTDIRLRVVHTGQHYDDELSATLLRQLEVPEADAYLGVGSASHAVQTARVMEGLDRFLDANPVDELVVVGDVNSTVAGALVGVKRGLTVSHVEAGLRSNDRSMPEEINRIVTDAIADRLFTPSRDADENLLREGVPPERIYFVGNVMVDTLLRFLDVARGLRTYRTLGIDQPYGYVTLHRPSNVDARSVFAPICDALRAISNDIPLVFTLHPRTAAKLDAHRLRELLGPRVRLVDPVGYLESISLQSDARFVLTDSGGIQEETTVLGVPCLTLRESTERPVTVSEGTNRVVGTHSEAIQRGVEDILRSSAPRDESIPELWDGASASRILDVIAAPVERRSQS